MQMMHPYYPGADVMTYANAPTSNGLTVLRWYAYMVGSLDTRTEPGPVMPLRTTAVCGGDSPKMQRLQSCLPVSVLVDNERVGVRMRQQV